jgi:hypothetical protein
MTAWFREIVRRVDEAVAQGALSAAVEAKKLTPHKYLAALERGSWVESRNIMLSDNRTEPLTVNIVYTHGTREDADHARAAELERARRASTNGEVDEKTMLAIVDRHRYENGDRSVDR